MVRGSVLPTSLFTSEINIAMNISAKEQNIAVQLVNCMKNLKLFSPTMPPTLRKSGRLVTKIGREHKCFRPYKKQ